MSKKIFCDFCETDITNAEDHQPGISEQVLMGGHTNMAVAIQLDVPGAPPESREWCTKCVAIAAQCAADKYLDQAAPPAAG